MTEHPVVPNQEKQVEPRTGNSDPATEGGPPRLILHPASPGALVREIHQEPTWQQRSCPVWKLPLPYQPEPLGPPQFIRQLGGTGKGPRLHSTPGIPLSLWVQPVPLQTDTLRQVGRTNEGDSTTASVQSRKPLCPRALRMPPSPGQPRVALARCILPQPELHQHRSALHPPEAWSGLRCPAWEMLLSSQAREVLFLRKKYQVGSILEKPPFTFPRKHEEEQ